MCLCAEQGHVTRDNKTTNMKSTHVKTHILTLACAITLTLPAMDMAYAESTVIPSDSDKHICSALSSEYKEDDILVHDCSFLNRDNASPTEKSTTATTHQTSEEWKFLCKDRIGGTLIWNKEKDIAVLYMNLGADCYSYYYFCFKKSEDDRMIPLAVFSTRSDYMHATDVKILQSGIQVTLYDGRDKHYTQFFSFESQRANIEIWEKMDPSEIFYMTPLYEELQF